MMMPVYEIFTHLNDTTGPSIILPTVYSVGKRQTCMKIVITSPFPSMFPRFCILNAKLNLPCLGSTPFWLVWSFFLQSYIA